MEAAFPQDVRPTWRIAAASVQGRNHARAASACQDRNGWQIVSPTTLIAAVADGAGSSSLGDIGATLAVVTAVETLGSGLTSESELTIEDLRNVLLKDSLLAARGAVLAEAETRGSLPTELATTLLVLVATPNFVAAAQIGDGAIVLLDSAGRLVALTAPQRGEHANETVFLVTKGAVEMAETRVWEGSVAGVAAFSDGVQGLALKMPEAKPHPPFFRPFMDLLSEAEDETEVQTQLEAFLRSPRVTNRADDDLTLLIARLMTPKPTSNVPR